MAAALGSLRLLDDGQRAADAAGLQTARSYGKLGFQAARVQQLTASTSLMGSINGPLASTNLDSSEKMQLGGMNGVRAYPTGEGSGSDAQLIQLELRHQLESGINMAAFYDWGQVWLQNNPNFPGGPQDNMHIYKGFGASIGYTFDDGISPLAVVVDLN